MDDFQQPFDFVPPAVPAPPAPDPLEPWSNADDLQLQRLNMAQADLRQQAMDGTLHPDEVPHYQEDIDEHRKPLLARKQQSEAAAEQRMIADAHQQAAVRQSIALQDRQADADSLPNTIRPIVNPITGKTFMLAPKDWQILDDGSRETGDPAGAASPEAGATPQPQTHTLSIDGQDFTYDRTPNGWQQRGFQGGPTQAEIEAEYQGRLNGGVVDPALAQRAMLDRAARAQGAALPPGAPHDGHAEAANAAGSLTSAEIMQNRAKAAMALAQTGIHPGVRGYARALADQIHVFNSASLREKQHVADAQRHEQAQEHAEKLRTDRDQRKQESQAKNDNYEKLVTHFLDKQEQERKDHLKNGGEDGLAENLKDWPSMHAEAEKRAAEVFKSKHGHYPEGFLAKQQPAGADKNIGFGKGEQQRLGVGERTAANLPQVPSDAAEAQRIMQKLKERAAAKNPPPANALNFGPVSNAPF